MYGFCVTCQAAYHRVCSRWATTDFLAGTYNATIRKVFCSVQEWGSLSQPASHNFGRTYFRQVSASVIIASFSASNWESGHATQPLEKSTDGILGKESKIDSP
jgi:hypothetical protein